MPSQAVFSSAVRLRSNYKDKVEAGIKAEALKWGIALPDDADLSDHVFFKKGDVTTRLRNRPIAANTSRLYEGQFRQFWRYCAIRGQYQPMLMLLSPAPKHVPSMELSVVEEFPRFKRLPAGTPLMSTDGSTQLKDVFGTPMTCDGGWLAPKNSEHFQAAISDIHEANERGGQYTGPCDNCRALAPEEQYKGCQHHLGEPRLFAKGNPVEHQDFKNTMETLKKAAIEDGYQENGSSQLLPSDLRIIRNHCLSSGTLVGLQTWVITISACKQGWRHDDWYDIPLEKFLPELFQIREDLLSAIALEVYGKADLLWIKQKMNADNEYPELCPCRPMLIYLHLIGIKGGYIFPSERELMNPPADGVYKTTIDYAKFLESFKELCYRILPARANFKIGTQTCRKAFYVLAIFGGGAEGAIQQSARHKSLHNSQKYSQDALTCAQTHAEHPNPSNNVCKWKAIHINGEGGNAALMTAYSGFEAIEPSLVGTYYVRTLLGVSESNPLGKNISFLISKAMRQGIDSVDPDEKLKQFIEKNIAQPEKASELLSIFGACVKKQVRGIVNASDQELLLARSVAVVPPLPAGILVQQPPKKKQKVSNDLVERHKLSDLRPREKLESMLNLWNDRNNWSKPLTSGAKSFNIKHLTPVMNCLEAHFDGNVDAFLEKYPEYKHTTFPKECCGGKGNDCTPKN